MRETVRPELSKKNKYRIDKHRYYELKYFCLQYPLWKKAYHQLDGLRLYSYDLTCVSGTNEFSDITGKCVEERSIYFDKMKTVEKAAIETDPYLASYILKAVTEGLSFDYLKTILEIPCSKNTYYERYRKFFWVLDKSRNIHSPL